MDTARPGHRRHPLAGLLELIERDPEADHLADVAEILRAVADPSRGGIRLAVIGQLKRGKSTLVNALLREELAATGQLELTFNISEFCHPGHEGDVGTTIHYRDGRPPRRISRKALAKISTDEPETLDPLRDVERIVFQVDNPLLRRLILVDTPGLGSVRGGDAGATLRYLGAELSEEDARVMTALGRSPQQVGAESQREIGTADAILFLFSRGRLHVRDRDTVLHFLGGPGVAPGAVSPLRAFGVLSACDLAWSQAIRSGHRPDRFDPLADDARPKIDRFLAGEPEVRQMFHTIVPVSGLLAEGACTLPPESLALLRALSEKEPAQWVRWLRDIGEFTRADLPDCPIGAAEAAGLARRLGAWGIYLACLGFREGRTEEQVREHLYARSGVPELAERIEVHFAARADLMTLESALTKVESRVRRHLREARLRRDRPSPLLERVAAATETIRADEHAFAELAVLRELYQERLSLDESERREVLCLLGEHGQSVGQRLGLPAVGAPPHALRVALAGAERWARRSIDPSVDRATRMAADIVRHSYGAIAARLLDTEAGRHG